MNNKPTEQDTFRSFQLMSEIESGEAISQRELAGRLGIAVGLVNSYLKNFVAKGYVRIKAFPRNRYAYLLTPQGLAEKSRLAYQHISYFTGLYTTTRKEYLDLFLDLREQGVRAVFFCGIDEVAEIAFLSLQEVGLELQGVVDAVTKETLFFGHEIKPLDACFESDLPIVLSSLKRCEQLNSELLCRNVRRDRLFSPVR